MIRADKRKRDMGGGGWAFSLPSSSALLPEWGSYHREHFNTTCPQTERIVWRHVHEDESAQIQRGGPPRRGERKQRTGSEGQGYADQTQQDYHCLYSGEKQQTKRDVNNGEPSVVLLKRSARSQFQVNKGRPCRAPAGADEVEAALISAPHYKGTQAPLQTPYSTTFPVLPNCHTVRNCWSRERKTSQSAL